MESWFNTRWGQEIYLFLKANKPVLETIRHPRQWIKGKAIPLQAWTGPEGSSRLRLPRFRDNRHTKVVRLSALRTGRLYSSGNIPDTHYR